MGETGYWLCLCPVGRITIFENLQLEAANDESFAEEMEFHLEMWKATEVLFLSGPLISELILCPFTMVTEAGRFN